MKNKKGYTLIELVISLGLISILILLTSNWYVQSYKLYTHFSSRLEANQNARLALQVIADNIRKQNAIQLIFNGNGDIILILNEKNKNIIDLRKESLAGQPYAYIYFDRKNRELRSNKNGEHSTLVWGVKEVTARKDEKNIINIVVISTDKNEKENVRLAYQLYNK